MGPGHAVEPEPAVAWPKAAGAERDLGDRADGRSDVGAGAASPRTRLDAVVFDLGNVVVRWDPYGPFEGVLERSEVEVIFAEIDFFEVNRAQDAGRSWAEGRAAVAARHPDHAWVLDRYLSHFPRAVPGPVPGTAEVIAALRRLGVRVLGLTNFSTETYPFALPAAPAIGLLEEVLVSGSVGLAKPDPAIFELLLARYALAPRRTVFVDDSPGNVAAAVGCGLHGLLFTDAPTLVGDLVALGLRLDLSPPAPS
jgi:2-haloacid dehalogenase